MAFGGPAVDDFNKAVGTGQVGCLCPSEGNGDKSEPK